jgi:hypothetical protein
MVMPKPVLFTFFILCICVQPLGNCVLRDERELTPELAREALLQMMRSKPAKGLGWFKDDVVSEISKMGIENEENGWYRWSAFDFHLSKAVYKLTIQPRPDSSACTFWYGGSFVNEGGRWVATPPKLLMTAMPKR